MPPTQVSNGRSSLPKDCSNKAKSTKSTAKAIRRAAGGKRKRKPFCRSKQSDSCRLLNLPGEIWDQIFRLVLVEDEAVIIDSFETEGEPALLRVCKSIRTEARDVYYCENKFDILIEDCDASHIFPFVKQYDSSAAGKNETRNIEWSLVGYPDPENITMWMLANHHSGGEPLLPDFATSAKQPMDPLQTVLMSAIKISYLMRNENCSALVMALEAMWQAMTAVECDCWW